MKHRLSAMALVLLGAAPVAADNWPGWRGPNGDGHTAERDLPLSWTKTDNVRWKVPLPAEGNATPVVWGDRVFLTQATEKGRKRWLYCLDRATGRELWKQGVPFAGTESTHATNPFCSASPVTDGKRVVVSHGSAGVFCYDFDGKELWKRDVGPQEHIWGNAASPVLWKDLVILWVGPGERQILLAMNRDTGATVWEHDEPGGMQGKDGKWVGSWSTPIVARVGDRDELILSVPEKVKAFDPATGKELWSCAGLTKLVYTSPLCSADGTVVVFSGFHGSALAVKAGGSGDVTKTHRLWLHTTRNPQRIGSAVILGDHAYLYNEDGTMQKFDLKTGKDMWDKPRVGGKSWSSLVAAGNRLYLITEGGETLVIEPGDAPKVVARSPLGELTRASVAVSDGDLFIRTYKHLWCVGKPQ